MVAFSVQFELQIGQGHASYINRIDVYNHDRTNERKSFENVMNAIEEEAE